jgi:hypothetical protein
MSTNAPKSATFRIVPTIPRIGPPCSEIKSDNRFMSDNSAGSGLQDATKPVDDEDVVDSDDA